MWLVFDRADTSERIDECRSTARLCLDLNGRDFFVFHLFSDSKKIPVTEIGVAEIRFFGYQ